MVEDVKEGEVGELLLQHKEDGVGEVDELGDVEDPGEVESSNRLWIVGVINRLTSQAVVSAYIELPPLAEPPGAGMENLLFQSDVGGKLTIDIHPN